MDDSAPQILSYFTSRIQAAKEQQLKELDLSVPWNTHNNDKLDRIPEEVFELTQLEKLKLSANGISTLPESITKLTNLIVLNLDDNELETPPLEIVNKGIKFIRDYFLQLAVGQDYIYEAKLIIVGEGGAGKTTLAKKIDNPDYKLQKEEPSTEGIDVITWKFNMPEKDREFQVNIWDFGGQEIYHATHQFFLTKRSLYALVADTRKEDTNFYYWMNVVELLTDNSPVLIIKNEKQDRHREIEEKRLRGEFTNLKDVLETNLNNTNRGLDTVIDNIKHHIKQLPHVGTILPITWVDVRKRLEELAENNTNYISLDTYINICKRNGFDKYENALQLSQYLHDLGVCLHFQEDPVLCKTVILQPEWGTDAVYKVLDDDTVIRNLGCFSKQDLANIWRDSKYQRMHNELLQLMIKFKLCYEIPHHQDNFIAPQLLTLNQSDYNWDQNNNLQLRYSYEFMPKGILTRFIVEMHRSIDHDYVWRTGVVLADKYAQAEVIEYYDKKEIRIKINGNNKRDLMTIVTNEIDKINNSYESIKYSKLIPCNCHTCNNNTHPHFYRLQELQERVACNKEHIECGKPPFHTVKVLSFIDDTVGRQNIDNSQKENKTHSSANFAGSQINQLILQQGNNKMENQENENTQESKIDNSDQSKNVRVGNIKGDFSPTNSPIGSDNAHISTSSGSETEQKGRNWGLIVSVAAILISICVGGLFNEEIREFFNLNSSSETPEEVESAPAN